MVICQTDKSSRFAIMTMQEYEEAGKKHTQKDQEVSGEFLAENQRNLNGHMSMLLKTFLEQGGAIRGDTERQNLPKVSLWLPYIYCSRIIKDGQ